MVSMKTLNGYYWPYIPVQGKWIVRCLFMYAFKRSFWNTKEEAILLVPWDIWKIIYLVMCILMQTLSCFCVISVGRVILYVLLPLSFCLLSVWYNCRFLLRYFCLTSYHWQTGFLTLLLLHGEKSYIINCRSILVICVEVKALKE